MRFRQGFTLLEMSIVLVIISVIMAGGAVTFSAHLQQRQLDETNFKIAAIQKALLDYRRTYNRLPCPSYMTDYDVEDIGFGTVAHVSSCGSATYQYDVNNSDNTCAAIPAGCIFAGLVPVREMKLPDDYAFDGWGRRFLYSVDRAFVQDDAFIKDTTISNISCDTTTSCLSRSPASPANQRIIIRTLGGTTKTNIAVYVLVSFGPNGHGAFGRNIVTASSTPSMLNRFVRNIEPYQVAALQTMNDGWEFPITTSSTGEFQIAAGGGGGPGPGYDAYDVRLASGSTNASELENCDCQSANGQDAVTGYDNVFVQGSYTPDYANPTNVFDDVVVFATRADLRSALE